MLALVSMVVAYDGATQYYDSPDTRTDTDRYMSKLTSNTSVFGGRRPSQKFRSWLTSTQHARYPSCDRGRYVLYISYACPWASRAYAVLLLKGISHINVSVVDYSLPNLSNASAYNGWVMGNASKKHAFLGDLYEEAQPGYRSYYRLIGKRPSYSVPVLYDAKRNEIVSTESADIIRMFNRMPASCAPGPNLEPEELAGCMTETDAVVYPFVNDGVYRMGFATEQKVYEYHYRLHWLTMDKLNARLTANKYLCGDVMTLSDIRLFVTLIRYDVVYYAHFKGSRNMVKEMDGLYRFTEAMMSHETVRSTVNLDHVVRHYYGSQTMINPSGIYPLGGSWRRVAKDKKVVG